MKGPHQLPIAGKSLVTKLRSDWGVVVAKKPPVNLKTLGVRLAKCATPEKVREFERDTAAYQLYMQAAGYDQGDLQTVNENRMRSIWKLGGLLAKAERQKVIGGGRGRIAISRRGKSLMELLDRIKLNKNRAQEARRIAALPKIELERLLLAARECGELTMVSGLVDDARPYWFKANRKLKHQKIAEAAKAQAATTIGVGKVGPFVLLYRDPPWKYLTYSWKGLEQTPDRHYPTLTDQEIIDFMIGNTPLTELSSKDAVMFMWCTSSNQPRAERVMKALGFEFKTAAVWVKADEPEEGDELDQTGRGLVFRNKHEVLLYGTKGDMPGPQYQPLSVFFYPRSAHSAKPPEIRKIIERMYPDFDASTRCELFCRDEVEGWTTFGFESGLAKAAE
jgi:N6-adenosine-specific RNA methylase IME4